MAIYSYTGYGVLTDKVLTYLPKLVLWICYLWISALVQLLI